VIRVLVAGEILLGCGGVEDIKWRGFAGADRTFKTAASAIDWIEKTYGWQSRIFDSSVTEEEIRATLAEVENFVSPRTFRLEEIEK